MRDPEVKRLHPATIIIVGLAGSKQIGFALIALIGAMLASRRGNESDIVSFAVVVLFALAAFIPALLRFLTVRYQLTPEAFTIWSGLTFKQTRTIPLERIQNVVIKRSLLQQMFGVSTVLIETASGAHAEADLSVVKHAEAERLVAALRPGAIQVAQEVEAEVYRTTFMDLLVAGATQNKGGLILAFLVGTFDQASQPIIGYLSKHSKEINPMYYAIAGSVLLIAVFILGWIWSILSTLITYFNFRLSPADGVLHLKYGFFTRFETAVPIRRVQSIRVREPIFQRYLGYCQMVADSAGSYEDKSTGGAIQLAPLIRRKKVPTLAALVFPTLNLKEVAWHKVSRLTIRRGILRYMLGFLVPIALLALYFGWLWLLTWPLMLTPALIMAFKRYKILGYSFVDGFILSRNGVWRRQVAAMPVNRVQSSHLTQDFFQSRLGLADLSVSSGAASAGATFTIVDLPVAEAIELQDRLVSSADKLEGSGV